MTALAELLLYETQLTGAIPTTLGKLAIWMGCICKTTRLKGRYRPGLGKLSKLRELSIQDNKLSGSILPNWAP